MPASAVITGPVAIGIDIGGTKIAGALVMSEPSGGVRLESTLKVPTPTTTDAFVEALKLLVRDLMQVASQEFNVRVQAIGVATAGTVNSDEGVIMGSTGNLPAIKPPFAIGALLKSAFGIPVHVENDANAAAYGEYHLARLSRPHLKQMLMITLGTGVGTGLIIDRKMYRGAHFCAGEGGHIAIGMNQQRLCTSGRYDTWESYASGTGLLITAKAMAAQCNDPDTLKALIAPESGETADPETLTNRRLMAAVSEGNPLAIQILESWHDHVALGLVSILNVLDPELTIIGGGLGPFVDLDKLAKRIRQRLMAPTDTLQLVMAQLGNTAGLVGASKLALEADDALVKA
ncbi:MAG: ROK family protein [Vampirovibrionales bacterium]|nr:ROK family protein [Vampirovibrionales bacterium]